MLQLQGVGLALATRSGWGVDILRDVSAAFHVGNIYAIAGASGSGKTTLIHVLAGIAVPTSGAVVVNDQPLHTRNEHARDRWRRRHCGLIFQDFRLLDELGPVANVLLPTWFGRKEANLRPRAAALLEELGVPIRTASVQRLSRGEQQRVALARALIMNPAIVLADEPTASLDEANAIDLIQRLESLKTQGKLIVCATHDQRILNCADHVLTLDRGRLLSSKARGTKR